jgi:hypothetical protein
MNQHTNVVFSSLQSLDSPYTGITYIWSILVWRSRIGKIPHKNTKLSKYQEKNINSKKYQSINRDEIACPSSLNFETDRPDGFTVKTRIEN